MTHRNAMPCEVRGVIYPSQRAAAAALGVGISAISQRLYKTGKLDRCGLGIKGGSPGNQNRAKPIAIAGIKFPTRQAAADALGISRHQLADWISLKASATQREMLYAAILRADIRAKKAPPERGQVQQGGVDDMT